MGNRARQSVVDRHMVKCPNCRQDNVFIDFSSPALIGDIISGATYRGPAISKFWRDQDIILKKGFWYCHLCSFRMHTPRNWLSV